MEGWVHFEDAEVADHFVAGVAFGVGEFFFAGEAVEGGGGIEAKEMGEEFGFYYSIHK